MHGFLGIKTFLGKYAMHPGGSSQTTWKSDCIFMLNHGPFSKWKDFTIIFWLNVSGAMLECWASNDYLRNRVSEIWKLSVFKP